METWKDIEGYEGLYQVNKRGIVKSLRREVRNRGGAAFRKERIIYPCTCNGYLFYRLIKDKNPKIHYQHRLIASAFIPNPENKPHVNHINSIRDDNRIENLEWATKRENACHRQLNVNKHKKTSLFIGVSYRKKSKKYSSSIYIDGKGIHLGCYSNEIDAHNSYLLALNEHGILNKYS